MNENRYFFQQEQRFSKKFFKKGSDIASAFLMSLGEAANVVAEDLPKSGRYALLRWMLSDDKEDARKPKSDLTETNIRARIKHLEKQGLVFKDKNKFVLTARGKNLSDVIAEKYNILKKPWDKKFRIVVFDIPEKKNVWRAEIRKELALMQYILLQKSVYIGKYPLARSFLKELDLEGIGQYLFIFTAECFDREDDILKLLV